MTTRKAYNKLEDRPATNLDCVMIEYPFCERIHREAFDKVERHSADRLETFIDELRKIAAKFDAEVYNKQGTSWYMFRFKSEKDKLAFILKNV